MYEFLHGRLCDKAPGYAVIDVHGVGYRVDIPLSTFTELPAAGQELTMLTHHHVREDVQKLFGFLTSAERDLFRMLITVNSVGPKVALNILSKIPVGDFLAAVNTQNTTRLSAVPGIGSKTAQRLIVELKGKLTSIAAQTGSTAQNQSAAAAHPYDVQADVAEALTALGYTESQVQKVLAKVALLVQADAPVQEWIKKALQQI